MIEIFKDIKDYEGLYQVSNLGKLKSLNYNRTGREEIMNPCKDKHGYYKVNLWKNRKRKTCLVHRLVAETFLPNPENKPFINHKIEGKEGKSINMVVFDEDGNIDKKKTTIEWCTAKENNDYGTRNERSAKTQSKPVLQLSLDGELIREWSSTAEVGRNGFESSAVCNCCNGKRKTHKGFRWEYKKEVV